MESLLQQLADEGFEALPPAKLGQISIWCRDYCWASGDAAYCVLADLFCKLDDAWRTGPIRVDTETLVSIALQRELPAVLTSNREMALATARTLREEVLQILTSQRR